MRCYEHSFLRRNWIQAQFLVSSTAPWPFLEEQILSRSPMPYKSCIDEYNSNPLTSSSIFNKIWPRPTNHTESPHQNTRVQAGGLITRVESVKSEVRSLKSEVGSLKSHVPWGTYFSHMEGGPTENVLTRYFWLRFKNNATAISVCVLEVLNQCVLIVDVITRTKHSPREWILWREWYWYVVICFTLPVSCGRDPSQVELWQKLIHQ